LKNIIISHRQKIKLNIKLILRNILDSLGYKIQRVNPQWQNNQMNSTSKEIPIGREHIKLHIGCRQHLFKDWINIDTQETGYEQHDDFYVFDITKHPLPFDDDSVEQVYNRNFIIMLNQLELIRFLAEILRILKPGAVHYIVFPDFNSELDTINKDSSIQTIISPQILEELALTIGYSRIDFNNDNHSIAPSREGKYMHDKDLLCASLTK
jgi:hypothetical protein